MKQDEIVSKSQLKRIEMQKESREKMKQNEVVESLKIASDMFYELTMEHKNIDYAIRAVELLPELIEFLEGWTEHDMQTEAWETLQCLLQQAKGES